MKGAVWKIAVRINSLILCLCLANISLNGQELELELVHASIPVFNSGDDGYACFRIPAIVQTATGDLLAFAEGRKNSCSDTNDIDLVFKRSEDNGITWSALKVLWDDDGNTCGNPAPVLDLKTGNIFLLATWNLGTDSEKEIIDQVSTNTRRIFSIKSTDDGHNWSIPKEITEDVKLPQWTWYATGPGSGIQIENGPYSDRLIIACDHIEAGTKKYYSHIIYSDDQGHNWKLGGRTPQDQVNECEVAELQDGRLMLNMRNYDRSKSQRQVAFSTNGGLDWTNQGHDPDLIEPICQASLQSYRSGENYVLLFSNPSSRDKREAMTLKVSLDEGATWPQSLLLHEGPSAYSDLIIIPNDKIGCLYERGSLTPYQQIVFAIIELKN